MSERVTELPRGWAETPLDVLVHHKSGNSKLIKGKLPKEPGPGTYPAFSASGQDVWVPQPDQEGPAVVVSAVGARCGKCFRADGTWSAIANTHVLRSDERALTRDFLWYLVNDERYWIRSGTAQPFVKVGRSLERSHLVPPLPEQRRIVAAIESYFTRLDDATATLERVQRNLERYRASVLKAAVEGRLVPTEAELAREEGRDYEPASVLLERILVERRRRWEEAELQKLRAKGKEPKSDAWKKKYKEPVAPDTSELPELPEGWCWASVGQLCGAVNGRAFKSGEWRDAGLPIIRIQNLKSRGASFNYFDGDLDDAHRVESGDLLFAWSGTPGTSFGAHVWRGAAAALNQHIFNIKFSRDLMHRDYFAAALNRNVAGYVASAQGGVGLAHITKSRFMSSALPLPARAEQRRIAVKLDEVESQAMGVASAGLNGVQRLASLRQSILKWAFEGKLVDQDPSDEPASVLLERIRAEREAAKPTRKRRTKKAAD